MDNESSSPGNGYLTAAVILVATLLYYYFGFFSSRRKSIQEKTIMAGGSDTLLPPVAIIGAGSIGAVVGLSLARQNNKVLLVGRKSLIKAVEENDSSLRLQDKFKGGEIAVFPTNTTTSIVTVTEDMNDLLLNHDYCSGVIIVATKTPATKSVAEQLAELLPPDSNATIISFQNGVRSASILRDVLLKKHQNVQILASMVNFNASWENTNNSNDGSCSNLFYKNTDGGVTIQRPAPSSNKDDDDVHTTRVKSLVAALTQNHVPSKLVADIAPYQYSKLLINLFNAVNALAGLPTPQTLEQTGYRKVWATAITEALTCYKQKGIKVASFRGLPPRLLPLIGTLPQMMFEVVLKQITKMDYESSKSSMLQDLERGRDTTEVNDLCGEIVRLGQETNTATPVNAALVKLVQQAVEKGESPKMTAKELMVAVGLEKN